MKKRNTRGIAGDILYTLIVTGIIILILIIYALASGIIKKASNIQGGVEQKFGKEGAEGYLYKFNFNVQDEKGGVFSNPENFEDLANNRYFLKKENLNLNQKLESFNYIQNPDLKKESTDVTEWWMKENQIMLLGNSRNNPSFYFMEEKNE